MRSVIRKRRASGSRNATFRRSVVKGNLDDVGILYALFPKPIPEQAKDKKTLSTSANTPHDLDEAVAIAVYELLQIGISLGDHFNVSYYEIR